MLIDDGLLTRSDGEWVPAGDLSQITVPPTIHALAARLDRLGRDERAVIERGSVEGKVFHRGAVAELSTEQLRESVWSQPANPRSERADPARTGPTLPGEDAFRFRHLLIRDAAYEAMPKELRAELHERFADWLDQIGLAEQDEIVGYHLEQAYRYRAELAPVDVGLPRRSLLGAGERLGKRRRPRDAACGRVRGAPSGSASGRSRSSPRRTSCDLACSRISDTRWSRAWRPRRG